MKQVLIRLILLSMSSMAFYFNLNAQDWKFIKEKDGIKVYSRSQDSTNVKSFKGIADFNTTMEKMKMVIGRVESFDWWDESITEIKVLAYEEEKLIRYYLVYDVPWPLTDRDLCAEAIITNDPVTGVRKVRATALPGVIPEKPDLVRIQYYWQQWVMEPQENGKIHVTLEGSIDPGGNIPTWLVNMVITDTPLNVMTKARNVVE